MGYADAFRRSRRPGCVLDQGEVFGRARRGRHRIGAGIQFIDVADQRIDIDARQPAAQCLDVGVVHRVDDDCVRVAVEHDRLEAIQFLGPQRRKARDWDGAQQS